MQYTYHIGKELNYLLINKANTCSSLSKASRLKVLPELPSPLNNLVNEASTCSSLSKASRFKVLPELQSPLNNLVNEAIYSAWVVWVRLIDLKCLLHYPAYWTFWLFSNPVILHAYKVCPLTIFRVWLTISSIYKSKLVQTIITSEKVCQVIKCHTVWVVALPGQ